MKGETFERINENFVLNVFANTRTRSTSDPTRSLKDQWPHRALVCLLSPFT